MAGIAGIYCVDGRPADVAEVQRMATAVEHRGPDGITYWNSGPIAFAYLQLCTTPESLDERQPLVAPGGEACLVWNGRLDNREELLEALIDPVDDTDPGLVLSAYLLWGTECVQHLVGDFVLVIWDARIRKLWCARDYAGIRPFFYFWNGKTFLFAPEIRALLTHPLVSLKINEGMVGEYLLEQIISRDETLYADICRLPSGSTLTISATGEFIIAPWWKPDLSLIQYRSDEEYADHFQHLIEQSVLSRMRCNTPWGLQLSGGLDSSTIAVTAQALLDRNGPGRGFDRDRVLTLSLACPDKPWDESEDIAAVVQHAGLKAESLQAFKADLDFFRQRAAYWRDFPGFLNGEPMSIPIHDAARQHGALVLMSGIGGDEWLQGKPTHIVDLATSLVRGGATRQSLRQARDGWKQFNRRGPWPTFPLRQLLVEITPAWLRFQRRKHRLKRHSILSEEFLRRTHLVNRLYTPPEHAAHRFSSRAQEAIFHEVISGEEARALEWNDRDMAHAGREIRYPFFDRRLAEFCLRLPEDQRRRGTVSKWVLRNAMSGKLPERVRTKAFKAEFSELFEAVLYDPSARARLQNLTMHKHTDWLNQQRFAEQMDLPAQPVAGSSSKYGSMWMVLGVDLWFENVLSSGVKHVDGC